VHVDREVDTSRTASVLGVSSGVSPALSAELRFVIECVRRSCGAPDGPLPTSLDWPEVLRHAAGRCADGATFWFSRNRLAGSYLAFSAARRA